MDSIPAGAGPDDTGGGPDQTSTKGQEAGISRHALIEALARFRLATAAADGAMTMEGASATFAGLAGGAGVGLAVPGMAPGAGGTLPVLSGLTEGFQRL